MLSYQHGYHAGNLADVHKHVVLADVLSYLTRKDKPLSYIETHAGRGLYDLDAQEALKTGEAAKGITLAERYLPKDHPYLKVIDQTRTQFGPQAYPGSPLIAQTLLRDGDKLHLAELHPQEFSALRQNIWGQDVMVHRQDGFELALSLCPPTPRRGVLLIDPSWEVKDDYVDAPRVLSQLARKWNVGVLMLWYPILSDGPHQPMLRALGDAFPQALRHEIRFPPARKGHRMVGSGMFVINPPYGLDVSAHKFSQRLAPLLTR